MYKLHTKIVSLIFLVAFLAFTSFIGFCHVEWSGDRDGFCPACKFQKSSIAAGTVEGIQIPQPERIDFVAPRPHLAHTFEITIPSPARAPPLV